MFDHVHRTLRKPALGVGVMAALLFSTPWVFAEPHDETSVNAFEHRAGRTNASITSDSETVVFSQIISAPDAPSIRVRFGEVRFGGFDVDGNGYLRLTGLLDGAQQIHDAASLQHWHRRSAYFNGGDVLVEAIATGGQIEPTLVEIAEIYATERRGGDGTPRSLCGLDDNRQLNNDLRVARVVINDAEPTVVCTASIINDPNGCFLTSGGCASNMDEDTVIEFNVPLTLPDGQTLIHPSPEDQYVPDLSSVQFQFGGDGEDWGYFGCFANGTTGMSPAQAQGDSFVLADSVTAAASDPVRGYGCGVTFPPVFRTWSYVPKETDGTLESLAGTVLSVRVDATGGDSGGAVTDAASDELIGILADDGCGEFVGGNIATAVTNEELRKALISPLGVCVPINVSFPNGLPDLVNPNGTTTVSVQFAGSNGTNPVANTGIFHYSTGGAYDSVPMTEIGFDLYEVTFPVAQCGTFVDFYFSVMTDAGVRFPDQLPNPVSTMRAVYATGVTTVVANNFDALNGWDISNSNVASGAFEIAAPIANANDGSPPADFDGSGQCVVTGAAEDDDLDGGPTRLRSPTINLSDANEPFVAFATWMNNDDGDDNLIFQISTSGGLFWDNVANFGDAGAQWNTQRFRLKDLVTPNTSTRFRFQVSDNPNNSRTEVAIDAFELIDYECGGAVVCTKGDINQDGLIDGADVGGFVSALIGNNGPGTVEFCATDFDGDNMLETGDDLSAFVGCLLTGVCP